MIFTIPQNFALCYSIYTNSLFPCNSAAKPQLIRRDKWRFFL